ncbi:MAG: PIG-L family deacetylase, partial [Firmicutes bacterium]|nr:PIG-L family deacetylase [Bacillota bacterium]
MASTLELLRQMVPPPRIDDCRRVLCVQPHPDDTDIGAGATVARLARLGAEVHYLTVTDGSAGAVDPGLDRTRLTALRRQEQEQAARILGVRELRWLDYPDAGDYSEYRVRLAVIRAIRELRPDLLLTVDPWTPYESHPDHLICGRAVAAAALLHGFAAVGDADAAVDRGARPRPLVGIAFYPTAHPNQYVA